MSAKQTIIVTGANGFLGSELTKHFARKGWRVIGMVHKPSTRPHKGVKYVKYDLSKPFDESVFEGADYMVHTAFVKYSSRDKAATAINITAAKKLIKVSRAHELKKNIFISSMSAHDEALSQYGQQKMAIEKLFNTTRDINFRSGLIIGKGGIVKNMATFMKKRRLVPIIGGGHQPLQIMAISNLVMLIDEALQKPDLSGTFTVANSQVYTYRQFYQALAKHLKIKVFFIPMPYFAVFTALRTLALLHLPIDVSEDNLLGLKQLRSVDNRNDLKKLGFHPDNLETALTKSSL